MTWTQFLTVITVIYVIYYGLNVVADILKIRKFSSQNPESEELFFNEEVEPEVVALDDDESDPATAPSSGAFTTGVLKATGGVGIKQLFELAKNDLIEYTKAIPY